MNWYYFNTICLSPLDAIHKFEMIILVLHTSLSEYPGHASHKVNIQQGLK